MRIAYIPYTAYILTVAFLFANSENTANLYKKSRHIIDIVFSHRTISV